MIADGCPFRATDNAYVLDGQDGEEQIFICPVIPVFVHTLVLLKQYDEYEINRKKTAKWQTITQA